MGKRMKERYGKRCQLLGKAYLYIPNSGCTWKSRTDPRHWDNYCIFPLVGKIRKISCGSGTCEVRYANQRWWNWAGWKDKQETDFLGSWPSSSSWPFRLSLGYPCCQWYACFFFFSGCLILQEHHKIRGSEVCIYVITVLGKAQAGNQLSFSVGKVRKGRMVFARPIPL